jgi:hypothetical protein
MDHSALNLDDADLPVASIEEDAFITRPDSSHSMRSDRRRTSAFTTTSLISSLPSDILLDNSNIVDTQKTFTPMKNRPAFRNPSSIRAMQMAHTPPFSPMPSPLSSRAKRMGRETQRSESALSARSHTHSIRSYHTRSESQRSGTPLADHQEEQQPLHQPPPPPSMPQQQQYPLVLLHITLLPLTLPYPAHLMELHFPQWLIDNFRMLENKMADSVLMSRGVLISHPREEYDVLEERLLESLELATPRILKCGHFAGQDEQNLGLGSDVGSRRQSHRLSAASTMSMAEYDEFDEICNDCHRPVGLPRVGAGTGTKRWEVKIYAANGLMKAGAWAAAWSEMERVDVEVSPWIPEDLRKHIEKAIEADAKEQAAKEEAAQLASQAPVEQAQPNVATHQIYHGIPSPPLSEKHATPPFESPNATSDISQEAPQFSRPSTRMSTRNGSRASHRRTSRSEEIPLGTLLRNYVILLAQDRRNIALALLSFLVLVLAMKSSAPPSYTPPIAPAFDLSAPKASPEVPRVSNFDSMISETVVAEEQKNGVSSLQVSTLVVTETVTQPSTATSDIKVAAPTMSREVEAKSEHDQHEDLKRESTESTRSKEVAATSQELYAQETLDTSASKEV